MHKWVFRLAVLPAFALSVTLAGTAGIAAVAIMTDTDNTGEQAVAWCGATRFLPPGP